MSQGLAQGPAPRNGQCVITEPGEAQSLLPPTPPHHHVNLEPSNTTVPYRSPPSAPSSLLTPPRLITYSSDVRNGLLAPRVVESVCVNSSEILFIIKTSSHSSQPVPVSPDCGGDRTSHLETGRSLLKGKTAAPEEAGQYPYMGAHCSLPRERHGRTGRGREREQDEGQRHRAEQSRKRAQR